MYKKNINLKLLFLNLMSMSVYSSRLLYQSTQTDVILRIILMWSFFVLGDGERRKRAGADSVGKQNVKRSKQISSIPRPGVIDGGGKSALTGTSNTSNSVLMNLLVSGCDVSAGYICLNSKKPYGTKLYSKPVS